MDCHFINWDFANCTDLTNIGSMQVELIYGIIAAVALAFLIYQFDKHRKIMRGNNLSKSLIRNSIIPMRFYVRDLIKSCENNIPASELVKEWKKIQEYRGNLGMMIGLTGDTISEEEQILLSKILSMLDYDLKFSPVAVFDQSDLHGLDKESTEYLKLRRDTVKFLDDEVTFFLEEKIKSSPSDGVKKHFQQRIDENHDIVADILDK